jgi:nitric oxide synthase-interacting protein
LNLIVLKNNREIFLTYLSSSYERSLLKGDYGKQRTRLTRDSFRAFDACNLCLVRCRRPVSCPNGDLFCRECAVENLLSQRKEIKRMQIELDRQVKEDEELRLLEEQEAVQKSVQEFELLQMGLEIRNRESAPNIVDMRPRVIGRENGKILVEEDIGGDTPATGDGTGRKRKFELDEKELIRLARAEHLKAKTALMDEKVKSSTSKLPSFWVPSLTPSVSKSEMIRKPPKLRPVCPASTKDHIHHYSLKSLVTVQFLEESDEKTKHGDSQRICPSCKKGLSNASKAMLAKPCGHVLCKPCAAEFVNTKSNDPHDNTEKSMRCYVCGMDLTDNSESSKENKDKVRPGLVLIQSDGTGFSAGGKVTTEKQGIAFQC